MYGGKTVNNGEYRRLTNAQIEEILEGYSQTDRIAVVEMVRAHKQSRQRINDKENPGLETYREQTKQNKVGRPNC